MRVIARAGIAAVSQRVVAREAGVPPSAVTYYFPAVDDLLVAALADCNDGYLRQLDECAQDADPIGALARVIAESSHSRRAQAAAENELILLAGRRPELQPEVDRWVSALDAYLAPHVPDPVTRAAAAATVDGLFLRCSITTDPPDSTEVRAILARVIGC